MVKSSLMVPFSPVHASGNLETNSFSKMQSFSLEEGALLSPGHSCQKSAAKSHPKQS